MQQSRKKYQVGATGKGETVLCRYWLPGVRGKHVHHVHNVHRPWASSRLACLFANNADGTLQALWRNAHLT